MNEIKHIESIITPPPRHWVGNGFYVHGMIPHVLPIHRLNPFIMLDLNPLEHRLGSEIERGVGSHPHKGFETVTIALAGSIEHHDSNGNHGVIREGGVQWMTAGKGILHKEYLEREYNKTGGLFSMVQLWVNLPQKYKLVEPRYQSIEPSDIPEFSPTPAVTVRLIAGSVNQYSGPAHTYSPILVCVIHMKKGTSYTFPLTEGDNTALVVISGLLHDNGREIQANQGAVYTQKGAYVSIDAVEDTQFLLLSGTPLNEPIAWHGPFVMNTDREIYEAIDEFNRGEFGVLE